MVSSLLAGIKSSSPMIEGGLMPESLTRRKNAANRYRWPASNRNGGRLQIGTPAGFKSEYPAGINRNPQPMQIAAFNTLASRDLIDRQRWSVGEVLATAAQLPDALKPRIEAANARDAELEAFLSVLASEYSLTGTNGLKDRTGLMEYRQDAV
jgi:hypothetical protein